jgi:hypothetical protein
MSEHDDARSAAMHRYVGAMDYYIPELDRLVANIKRTRDEMDAELKRLHEEVEQALREIENG